MMGVNFKEAGNAISVIWHDSRNFIVFGRKNYGNINLYTEIYDDDEEFKKRIPERGFLELTEFACKVKEEICC
jgi:hypothetical protein